MDKQVVLSRCEAEAQNRRERRSHVTESGDEQEAGDNEEDEPETGYPRRYALVVGREEDAA